MNDKDQSDNDSALFRDAVGEVRRLHHDKAHNREQPRPDANPQQLLQDEARVKQDLLSDSYLSAEVQPGDILDFHRGGLQRNVLKKLRRGEFRNDAELDLHGLTAASARVALVDFLARARQQDWRCIRVIHGKGLRSTNEGPVLKGLVNQWLRQRDEVLAFHSARPEDGGTGAVYVLLKSHRP